MRILGWEDRKLIFFGHRRMRTTKLFSLSMRERARVRGKSTISLTSPLIRPLATFSLMEKD